MQRGLGGNFCLIYKNCLWNSSAKDVLLRYERLLKVFYCYCIGLHHKIQHQFGDRGIGIICKVAQHPLLIPLLQGIILIKDILVEQVLQLQIVILKLAEYILRNCLTLRHICAIEKILIQMQLPVAVSEKVVEYLLLRLLAVGICYKLGQLSLFPIPPPCLSLLTPYDTLLPLYAHSGELPCKQLLLYIQSLGGLLHIDIAHNGIGNNGDAYKYVIYKLCALQRVSGKIIFKQLIFKGYEILFVALQEGLQLCCRVFAGKTVGVFPIGKEGYFNLHSLCQQHIYSANGGFYAGKISIIEHCYLVGKALY